MTSLVSFDSSRPEALIVAGVHQHLTPGAIRAFRLLFVAQGTLVSHQNLNAALHATTWRPKASHPQECPQESSCGSQSLYDVISELRHAGLCVVRCNGRGYSYTGPAEVGEPRHLNPENDPC